LINKDVAICHKCFLKFKPKLKPFKIGDIKGYYIYDYDNEVKEKLYQFKGCFDIELVNVFLDYFKINLMLKYFGYIMIPAPSSKEADEERGFNHVQKMFGCLNLKMINCVFKTENFKQSDLSFEERKQSIKKFKISDINLSKKRLLIVDDVYTSGSTVKAIIELLKSKNPKKIKVLVMSKTIDPHALTQ